MLFLVKKLFFLSKKGIFAYSFMILFVIIAHYL